MSPTDTAGQKPVAELTGKLLRPITRNEVDISSGIQVG